MNFLGFGQLLAGAAYEQSPSCVSPIDVMQNLSFANVAGHIAEEIHAGIGRAAFARDL
jgi:hypothetical protein